MGYKEKGNVNVLFKKSYFLFSMFAYNIKIKVISIIIVKLIDFIGRFSSYNLQTKIKKKD